MSNHKFTGDRSDMAHRIKQQLRSGTAIQPPPVVEDRRWGVATDMDPIEAIRRYVEADLAFERETRHMITNPAVEVKPKEPPRGR